MTGKAGAWRTWCKECWEDITSGRLTEQQLLDAFSARADIRQESRLQDDLPVCDYWPTCAADELPCEDCRAHARQHADNTGHPLLGVI